MYNKKNKDSFDFPIDVVYTWVDDENYIISKQYTPTTNINKDSDSKNRYTDHDELKYSLRSVEKYAPWVRKIYIVTDRRRKPKWLDHKHPKIQMIDHKDIFVNKNDLPTFNSQAIESNLDNIPGLSEYFIYLNDDMMFGNNVDRSDFFTKDNKLIVSEGKNYVKEGEPDLNEKAYFSAWKNNIKILNKLFERKRYKELGHQAAIIKKSSITKLKNMYSKEFNETSKSRFRNINNIAPIGLVLFYLMNTKEAEQKEINGENIHVSNNIVKNKKQYDYVLKKRPKFLCVQDEIMIDTKEIQKNLEDLEDFFEKYFPNKSSFENGNGEKYY